MLLHSLSEEIGTAGAGGDTVLLIASKRTLGLQRLFETKFTTLNLFCKY